MKNGMIHVAAVQPGSAAEDAGIEPGDGIISINGENISDVFDYRFLTADEHLELEIQKANGDVWEVEIEKDEYEDLGIDFENSLMDEEKSCTNRCIFCFIDQLPKGMRETLYFKDDDSRLSFLTGNYVTLTNMSDSDIDRIIRYRMSPINVSVHTTNPDLRIFMLSNRFAGKIVERVARLVRGGIEVNCQIVLCHGVNDGRELDRTITDLSTLYPGMRSISVVPVGITKHRQGLLDLVPYNRIEAAKVVDQIEKWQAELQKNHGSSVVYAADEFYLMAGRQMPDYEAYEDFPQLENGVGLVALLKYEFHEFLEGSGSHLRLAGERTVSIATGVSAYGLIKDLASVLEKRFAHLKVNVYAVENRFFGETVTVTGLLTGQDILARLEGEKLGKELLIAQSMLKAGEEVFLDDLTLEHLKDRLGVKVTPVGNSGSDFVAKVLGIEI